MKKSAPKDSQKSGGELRGSLHPQWAYTAAVLRSTREHGWHEQHPEEYADLKAAHFLLRWAVRRGFHQRIGGASLVEVAELRCVVAIGELREAAGRLPAWQKLKHMTGGRKPGAVSRLNKAIHAAARAELRLSAEQLWERFAAKPPKGYVFRSGDGLGLRVETVDGEHVMRLDRFCNVVSEGRSK